MKVRLAIVGCGAIAEEMHVPAAIGAAGVRLEALVDPDAARRTRLQKRFDVPRAVATLAEIVSEVDAVVLCTPPHLHRDMALQAFEFGLHVLCEKPMANSSLACAEMIAAARESGRVLAMAHIFRFYPSRQAVKTVLSRGSLGAIRRISVEQGKPYSWQTVTGYNMRRELSAGGVLIDGGIHPLDTLLWWCGPPASFKYEDDACGGLESNARLRLQASAGYPVSLRISRTCNLANTFRIEAEDGTVVLSAYATGNYEIHRGSSIEKISVADPPVSSMDCGCRQVADFAESIRGLHPPCVAGDDAAQGIALIEQCYAGKRARPWPDRAPLPGLTW